MMGNAMFEEENIIKDIKNLFRLEKGIKVIKDRIEILRIFLSIKRRKLQ